MHRAKKHLFPKTMQASLELAQLDSKKSSQELINLQKKELEVESQILNNLKVVNNGVDSSTLTAINNDIKQLTESFQLFAVKSFQELKDINNNVKEGLSNINSSLLVINESILNSSDKIIDTLKEVHSELKKFVENPSETAAIELRLKARERLESAYASEKHRVEDLEKSIKLYNSALDNEVGETDPMTWLELGYAYSFKKESENALRAFERADQYSVKGASVNYKIKNQALHNIALIHTSNKNFGSAYPQIKEVTDSKQDYDNSSLILKGINEVLLGYENEGMNQIKIGLNESPELIKDIYFYVEEGILSNEFCQRFIDLLLEEKTSEISNIYNNYQTILNDLNSIWEKYPTNRFNNIIERSHSLFEDFKKSSEHGFISLHGIKNELQKLLESLKDELKNITQKQVENQKLKVEEERKNLDDFKRNVQREEQKYQSELFDSNEELRSGFFKASGVIGLIVVIFLMNKLPTENWWLRLLFSAIIVFVLYWIIGGLVAGNNDKNVNERLQYYQRRAQQDEEQIQNKLDLELQNLSNLEVLYNKI